LHPLHKAYLNYYAAAAYETLGHITHDYSSSKLPLLNMAKDCYVACDVSLATASATFNKERDALDVSFVETDRTPFDLGFPSDLSGPVEYEEPAAYSSGSFGFLNPAYGHDTPKGFYSPNGTDTCFEEATPRGSPSERNFGEDDDDYDYAQLQMSAHAKMMPEPLCIRKAGVEDDPFLDSPLSKVSTHQPRYLTDAPPTWPTLFSEKTLNHPYQPPEGHKIIYASTTVRPPPLMVPLATTTTTINPRPKPTIATNQTQQTYTRILSQITSLRAQISANIEGVTELTTTTTDLQRIHTATKDKRLASFWSFTPAVQNNRNLSTPSNCNGTRSSSAGSASSQQSNGSDSGSGGSRTSSGTGCSTVADPGKRQRIERLRAQNWRTVGLRGPESGWKGEEYYEQLCAKALDDLHGN
jgi:hypothetical protein